MSVNIPDSIFIGSQLTMITSNINVAMQTTICNEYIKRILLLSKQNLMTGPYLTALAPAGVWLPFHLLKIADAYIQVNINLNIIFILKYILTYLPEYLISTLPHPRRMYRHTYRPRKTKNCPQTTYPAITGS